MDKYTDDMLIGMIREVEKEFPLEVHPFPTSNIRDIIANPDHPDEEGRECGEPFLNQNWKEVTEEQWYENDVFVSFATSKALAYFLPSIIRFSYLDELMETTRYMSNVEEWTMNIIMVYDCNGKVNPLFAKRTHDIYSLYTKKQLNAVEKWIQFENRRGYFSPEFKHGLDLLKSTLRCKEAQDSLLE